MSSRKLDKSAFTPVIFDAGRTHLTLAPEAVRFHKSGIEFCSPVPLTPWVEMTVELESPRDRQRVTCNGIVVACDGSRLRGYTVSMLLTGLDASLQARLTQMAFSALA